MVGVGIVGIGFMGMIHYLAARRVEGAQVVAFCSRDPKKLAGDWTSIQGNFGPRGTQMDLTGVACTTTSRRCWPTPQVDLVDLCVPNDAHGRMAIQALQAGKPVLVEKPIALSIDEADAMVAAAREAGKPLMVGHVLPFVPEFAFALEASARADMGRSAPLISRVISRPDWSSDIADPSKSGGPAIDLHIHDTHFISLLCGVPRAVHSSGVVETATVVHLTTQYLYARPEPRGLLRLRALSQAGRPFTHGFELYLDAGDDRLRVRQPRRAGARGDAAVGDPARWHGRTAGARDRRPGGCVRPELAVATQAAASRSRAAAARGRPGTAGPLVCLAEVESVQTRKVVEVA